MIEALNYQEVCLLLKKGADLVEKNVRTADFFPLGRGIHVILKSENLITKPTKAAEVAESTIKHVCQGGVDVAGGLFILYNKEHCPALYECNPIKSAFKNADNDWKPAVRSHPLG